MKRISISFYDDIYEKLEQRMKEESANSVAQCVRELVDLGLKIEAAAKTDNPKSDVMDLILELKNLLKNGLNWSLETRLLARHLVEKEAAKNQENVSEILDKYKNSSTSYVQGLYGDKVD